MSTSEGRRTARGTGVLPPGAGDGPEAGVVFLGVVVGALAGLVGAGFHRFLDAATAARDALRSALELQPPSGWPFPEWIVPGWMVTALVGAIAVAVAIRMVVRIAPEAAGSGIHEVEGVLAGLRALRWRRVLPVKFIGGLLAIGAGLVLGREGPTIHMGSALGGLIADHLRLVEQRAKTLVAAGAGAGLAAAFNAPLAGIIFVTEEMRSEFDYTFTSLHTVIAASCTAVIVSDWWLGQGPSLPVQDVPLAPLFEAPLFLLLGVIVGAIGVGFNWTLLHVVAFLGALRRRHGMLVGAAIGAVGGTLVWFAPAAVGGGEILVENLVSGESALTVLLGLFALRFATTMGSYGSGAPGGIFAPMLALGTLAGMAFGTVVAAVLPDFVSTSGMFTVAAMGALFAATVDAPLTGIVLVVELTGAHQAVLTITLTCLAATITAKTLGGRAIYTELLELALRSTPEASTGTAAVHATPHRGTP